MPRHPLLVRQSFPPFTGCCKSNPCDWGGCPVGDLTPGFLSGNGALACQFYPNGCDSVSSSTSTTSSKAASSTSSSSSESAVSTSTSSSSSSVSSLSSFSTSSLSATSTRSSTIPSTAISSPSAVTSPTTVSHHSSTGAIAGGVAGGVAGLAAILILLYYWYRHAAKSRKDRNDEVDAQIQSREPSGLTAIPEFTPETKALYQDAYNTPSSTDKPFPSPPSNDRSLSPTFPLNIPSSPSTNQPPSSTPYHSHHDSYELPATPSRHSPRAAAGLSIYNSRPTSPPITRRPVPTSPTLSELSAEEVQRRAELSSTNSVRGSPNLSQDGGQSPRSTWTASSGVGVAAERWGKMRMGDRGSHTETIHSESGRDLGEGGVEGLGRRDWGRAGEYSRPPPPPPSGSSP